MAEKLLPTIAAWAAAAVLYGLLTGTVSETEAIAGGAAATATTLFAGLHRRVRGRPMRLRAPWLRLLWRTARAIGSETLRSGKALMQAALRGSVTGAIERQPFRSGDSAGEDAGRRALVTIGISLPPNGYVTSLPEAGLAVHRLVPVPPKRDTEWPV